MSGLEPSAEAIKCNDRVLQIRESLFGNTTGNKYRAELNALREKGEAVAAVAKTRMLLIDAVFDDQTMAVASLAQLAKKSPHGATIYLALDLANLSLMNPTSRESEKIWVRDMSHGHDAPIRLVLDCLETLERSLNGGKLEGQGSPRVTFGQ